MSGSETSSDGSGNSSDKNSSNNSVDCEEIASALATLTSSGGTATSTTRAGRQQELGGPAETIATTESCPPMSG